MWYVRDALVGLNLRIWDAVAEGVRVTAVRGGASSAIRIVRPPGYVSVHTPAASVSALNAAPNRPN